LRFVLLIIIFLFGNKTVFAQLEFTQSKRTLHFVGAEKIENKYIIAGVYIKPIDSTHLRLDVSISDDWIPEDSLDVIVTLDSSSLSNSFYIHNPYSTDSCLCYIFKNDDGYSIKIQKESFYYSKDKEGNRIRKIIYPDMVQICLPQSRRSYVSRLPVMFKK
jgi:hypothetical protein